MIHYTISGDVKQSRLLSVVKASMQRFRFFTIEGTEHVPIKFNTVGGKCIAAVNGLVMVYVVPNSNDFHREYMQHNARAMWCGLQADPDRLLDNMLDYVEAI